MTESIAVAVSVAEPTYTADALLVCEVVAESDVLTGKITVAVRASDALVVSESEAGNVNVAELVSVAVAVSDTEELKLMTVLDASDAVAESE